MLFRSPAKEFDCEARIKHRQPLQKAKAYVQAGGVRIVFDKKQRAIAPGQYAVVYIGELCLGGGAISRAFDI